MAIRWKDSIGWIFLLAALLVGGLAFWLSQTYLQGQEQMLKDRVASSGGKMVEIVVASGELNPGEVIGPGTMSLGRLPERHVSKRMFRTQDFERAQGRVLTQRMSSGEPLMLEYVAGLAIEKFSDLLAEGERAVSLEARAMDTHSGMVLPGDYVDLYVLVDAQSPPSSTSSKMAKAIKPVIERVRVLAAGASPLRAPDQRYLPLTSDELDYSLITVGVPIVEAERLILAREEGRMAYLLRNQADKRDGGSARQSNIQTYRYLSAALPQGVSRSIVSLQTLEGENGTRVVSHSGEMPAVPMPEPTVEGSMP